MSEPQSIDLGALAQHRLALLGNPNCGKTALFNRLTGSQQKVGNYAGVTVELKRGLMKTAAGRSVSVIDLPGSYSLNASSEDEAVACSVVLGLSLQERAPDLTAVILDATRLRRGLRLVAALKRLQLPQVVVVNMMDRVRAQGRELDLAALERAIGAPVVEATGITAQGTEALRALLDRPGIWQARGQGKSVVQATGAGAMLAGGPEAVAAVLPEQAAQDDAQAQAWLAEAGLDLSLPPHSLSHRLDAVLLQPLLGSLVLLVLLFLVFQAVFSWAAWPMGLIEAGTEAVGQGVSALVPEGLLRSLLVDGVVAGAGGVLVFLPQILILFFFILLLEESGYLPRAALLLDRLMGGLGLSGRSFIPLLSSFACAIPGIMAARTIADRRARWVTILIAPLMTCSARLPVYAVIIAAFVPNRPVGGVIGLQGLVLFALYVLGIVGAMVVALILRGTITKGAASGFIMEMPKYQLPRFKDMAIGLWQRAWIFLRRAGTIIFQVSGILWLVLNFPRAEAGKDQIDASIAGHVANGIAVVVQPIGFNRDIALALIPAMAAREVAVSSLATTYAVASADEDATSQALADQLKARWSLPTALAFLAWFVFAPQCISTIAVTRRETNSWRWPAFMVLYLFALAYVAARLTDALRGAAA